MFILKQANLELPLDMGVHRSTQHTTSSVPYRRELSCQDQCDVLSSPYAKFHIQTHIHMLACIYMHTEVAIGRLGRNTLVFRESLLTQVTAVRLLCY